MSDTVLVLSAEEVERLLPMEECIEAMASVLASLARGELYQPLRSIAFPPGARGGIGLMPAHRGGATPVYSLKEIVVTPDNPTRGLDAHQGGVLLHDGETGELRAVLNASPITAIRTAAVSAVATRALARDGAHRVAIIGGGVQGKAHVQAMTVVLPEAEIGMWSRRDGGTAEELVRGADVVCTCTTSREPVVPHEWLAPGTHINAVGSSVPASRELEEETVRSATLVVDRRESALSEAGDLIIPGLGDDAIDAELGEVLVGAHPGRRDASELTVFKSLGLAIEDLAAAELVVRKAREQGVGTEVPF